MRRRKARNGARPPWRLHGPRDELLLRAKARISCSLPVWASDRSGSSTAWAPSRPDSPQPPDFLRITVKSELIRARFGSDISPQGVAMCASLLPLPACGERVGVRGPLHKGRLAEGEGAFPRNSDSWRGPLIRNLREERKFRPLHSPSKTGVNALMASGRGNARPFACAFIR